MAYKCIGCGAEIQTTQKGVVGFSPKEDAEYCQRCFQIKHYNKASETNMASQDYLDILHNIEPNSLVLYVVDIFDFHGSFINGLNRITSTNDIILVGNKLDLFPKSVNPNKVIHWMRKASKDLGLKVIDAEVISSVKDHRIENVIKMVNKYQNGRNVYVVGCTNVGKSTFINSMIKFFTGEENVITTSIFPGTTLSTIEIEMNNAYIIDTPGVVNKHQVVHYLDKSLRDVTPYKGIKPSVFQVLGGQTFYIGGFARVDYPEGELSSFVFYNANKVPIRRTKLENADRYYENNKNTLLVPPVETEKQKLGEWSSHRVQLKADQDIVISGLGFMTVNNDVSLVLHLPANMKYFVRESIF